MEELKHELLSNEHTQVFHEEEDEMEFNAPHHFVVVPAKEEGFVTALAEIDFQSGPIKENGVNGVMNEDLLAIVITRLQHFQNSEFSCRENEMALTKLEEALMWLNKRRDERKQRGVLGTNEK
ncbi:hypothetical protein BSP36_135 [Bacillus phage BSP36]|nr:hypothetical protein BSP36_135 [Bacillus phage BSP36]